MTVPCSLTDSAIYREITRHSARFYALRAASGADGSRPIPTLLPEKGLFRDSFNGRHICRPYRAIPYYNNVGRGDPTPPREFAAGAGLPGRAMLAPTDQPVIGSRPILTLLPDKGLFLTNQSAEANASALFAVIRFFGTPESGTRSRWSRCRRRQGVRRRRRGCSSNRGSSQTGLAGLHPAR